MISRDKKKEAKDITQMKKTKMVLCGCLKGWKGVGLMGSSKTFNESLRM